MKKAIIFLSILLIFFFGIDFVFSFGKDGSMRGDFQATKNVGSQTWKNIKESLPQPKFSLKEGDVLKEKVKIQVEVSESLGIEFYLRQTQSLVEFYLGSGEKKEEGKYEIEVDTENIPNGDYFLFAKILTSFGEYSSPEIKISISNEPKRDPQKEEEIKSKIEFHFSDLERKTIEEEKTLNESKIEIEKIVEETTKKIEEKLPEKEKEEIKASLEKEKRKAVSEAQKGLENLKKVIEEEVRTEKNIPPVKEKEKIKLEKENIKERVVKETVRPIEKAEEKLPKEEVLVLKREAEEKVKGILENLNVFLKEKIKEKSEISPLTLLDSDDDGLSDWDEIRLGTDPFSADTDNDGYLDGVEVRLGFDPLKPGPADKVIYQDVRKFGKVSERIKIEKVEIVVLPENKEKLKISGWGIPNSFLTIYIYSKPIIALAKVGPNGYFEYILDKSLADGTHTVYVALTNNKGEIEEKSSPFVFIKSGNKILRISEFQAEVPKSPVEILSRNFLILTISLILLALSLTFFLIGFLTRKQIIQK